MVSPADGDADQGRIVIRDVGDILDLLVRHLYGNDPHLTLRELIQNAHDALVELPPNVPHDNKPIVVKLDDLSPSPCLDIIDQGIGMSREDIETKLCVVGNSDKLRSSNLVNLIGRYGIGFLSSFIVADHVEVLTRKYGSNTSLLWSTKDKETWTIREISQNEFPHGTRVRLYFRSSGSPGDSERMNDLRYLEGIEDVLRQHCYLLPFAIQVGQVSVPGNHQVNARAAPWDDSAEAREAFHALFGVRTDALYAHQFSVYEARRDLHASGVLYFQDEIQTSSAVRLHVKRMLVDSHVNRLLPTYAVFVQGIIECPELNFDLARRTVPDFDPAYQWLRGVVAKQFQSAFVRFAERRPDDFFKLWPDVDNTVISRLVRAWRQESGDEDERYAESFVLAAAKYFPFFVVDEFTGAQGRPLWRSIDDLMTTARRRGRVAEGEKVTIYYSETPNPVEKDMLLTEYAEIIDVGRPEKTNHRLLMDVLAYYNDRFDDFQVQKVSVSRLNPISSTELKEWEALVSEVQQGLFFGGRSHDVQVETFEPSSTPVVITDSTVDPEVLETVRAQLETTRRAPGSDMLVAQLLKVVESMKAHEGKEGGGVLTIHINAQNPMMQRLRSTEAREVALLGVMSVCWRAVLDYFGWNSTRQMLLREKQFTEQLIRALLELAERRITLVMRADQLEAEASALRSQVQQLGAKFDARFVDAFIGVLDIEGSTARIVAHPGASPEQKVAYLRYLLSDLKEYLSDFANVVGFTGDGLQFYIESGPALNKTNLRTALGPGLSYRLTSLAERVDDVRMIVDKTHFETPRVRVALSYGVTYLGQIISDLDIMGFGAVQATRICSHEDWYRKAGTSLLITEDAYNQGPQSQLWRPADFELVDEFTLAGLSTPVKLYKPVGDRGQ